MNRLNQKRINKGLNIWIRAPGCISHSVLTFIAYNSNRDKFKDYNNLLVWTTIILTFWNGIYFMEQVVSNHAIEDYKIKNQKKLDDI